MFIKNVNYAAGCRNCRVANKYQITLMSEEQITNPSRLDLVEEIDQNIMVCTNCGKRGNMLILFFKVDNIIYDMQTSPKNGKIQLHGKKSNLKIHSCELVADIDNLSPYDYLNSLYIFQTELSIRREKYLLSENPNPKYLQSFDDGNFIFTAKLNDGPPYIISYGYFATGFSYEEINEVIYTKRKEIQYKLTEANMLY
jgi:hypothetical protein